MIYLQLFWSFLQIGLFSFGGGYAAIPLIQGQIVDRHGWLSMPEFTDLVTISQMTPGPIAINSATFVGIKIAGLAGAAVATLGCILPSCVIVTLIARLYLKYRSMALLQGVLGSLRPAVVAMIASAGVSILVTAFWGDAVIALGAVIRGSTSHYDYVCNEVSKGIAAVSLETGVPVMFGVITTENIEQAIERSGSKAGNKGSECAEGAVEMVNLIRSLEA